MEQCRLCLAKQKPKNLLNLFSFSNNISYSDMISSIANVKILANDGKPDKMCNSCRRMIKECYDFKNVVEKSDRQLSLSNGEKRLYFSDVKEIKLEFQELEMDYFNNNDMVSMFKLEIDESNKSFFYNNTTIKKVEPGKNPIPVLDFLENIKNDDNDNFDYGMSDYSPYPCDGKDEIIEQPKPKRRKRKKDDDYLPPAQKKQKERQQQAKLKKVEMARTELKIKPVYLKHIKMEKYKPPPGTPRQRKTKIKHDTRSMCPICGIFKMNLKSHILTHSEREKFTCDDCGKVLFSKKTLVTHMKVHKGILDYKCDQCTAVFATGAALKSHMLSHSVERNYVCSTCSKKFKNRYSLMRHTRFMHTMAKNIKCEECGMCFLDKSRLVHHMRVHTQYKPFNCELCSQPYSYKRDFNRHCIKKHGVFLKRRHVPVMNAEVLARERELMKDLVLRAHGIVKEGQPVNPFDGPQAPQAYQMALDAIRQNEIPISIELSSYLGSED